MSQTTDQSLEEVNRSVRIPAGHWWKRMLAFAGPAYMVSVGYMDPGNWATDIAGGSQFGYRLIWILLLANLLAILLQTLSARLGLVTGRDLAQACRDSYGNPVRWALFGLCEIAIAACDLAEVLGTAIGINLLTATVFPSLQQLFGVNRITVALFPAGGIPLIWAVVITGLDVLILLVMQRFGIRKMEAFIVALITVIGVCFIVELFLSKPDLHQAVRGFVPHRLSGVELYVAIGILGATVMPHNLYMHSALVQSRDVPRTREGLIQACRYNLVDSVIALNGAFFVNAAILIVAAAAFASRGIRVDGIPEAHNLLSNLLGKAAPIAFAIALICAGQSSTLTGTLAGQITMEGFLQFRLRPWLRRLITRSLAIIPAVLVIGLSGDKGTNNLLILSQVILSLQLPFAVVPLIKFTNSRVKMGEFASWTVVKVLGWAATIVIIGLNVKLVGEQVVDWAEAAGRYRWLVLATVIPSAAGLGTLLLYLILKPERRPAVAERVSAEEVAAAALAGPQEFRTIGVALEVSPTDAPMLAEAIVLARAHDADLVLMHVVEGVGGQWYGAYSGDTEALGDEGYLRDLARHLSQHVNGEWRGQVRYTLGYGDVPRELIRMAGKQNVDLMVVGGHGHHKLADVFRGETIAAVRHGTTIPVFAVRGNVGRKLAPRGQ